jgi:hypothetical protein
MTDEPTWKERNLSGDVPHQIWEFQQNMTEIASEVVIHEQTEPSTPLYTIPGPDGSGAYGAGPYGS